MSKIFEFFTWVFASLILFWVLAMFFSMSPCQRVNRSAWPVVFIFSSAEYLTKNWTTPETQLSMLGWKASSAVNVQSFFEKTVYGDTLKCSK